MTLGGDMRSMRLWLAGIGTLLVTAAACGGGSSAPNTPPSSTGAETSTSPSPQAVRVPEYGRKFEPLSQAAASPKSLLSAFRGNFVRSVAAYVDANTGLSQRYLRFIVGADATAGAPYQLLYSQVAGDAQVGVGYTRSFRSYVHDVAGTYTIKGQRSSSQRITLDVIQHQPALPGDPDSTAVDNSLTLVFVHQAKGKDQFGGRFVLTDVQTH